MLRGGPLGCSLLPLVFLPVQHQRETEDPNLDLSLYSPWEAAEPNGLESSEQITKGPKVGSSLQYPQQALIWPGSGGRSMQKA